MFCPFLLKGQDRHGFVQRYPLGGALGGTAADRGQAARRNSASALVTGSKVQTNCVRVTPYLVF